MWSLRALRGATAAIVQSNSVRYGRSMSMYKDIPVATADKILGLNEAFKADPSQQKVNLIVGAYRDDNGEPKVLDSVRVAHKRIFDRHEDHEYAGIGGIASYIRKSLEFAYGSQSSALKDNRVAAIQTLSGTGACRIAAEFIGTYLVKEIYLPNPTWANHVNIFREAGVEPLSYNYYDKEASKVDFDAIKQTVIASKEGSWFLFHSCAHNPTGYDLSREQWRELSQLILHHKKNVIFDNAYQGFATGDAEADAFAIRLFIEDGHNIMLSQSFAKNFGLYGERVGTLSIVTDNANEKVIVDSQLKRLARAMYSNPPIFGAKIVTEILSDRELMTQWEGECRDMAERMKTMRILLRAKLEEIYTKNDVKRDWTHVTKQIGMFSFLGLTTEQVLRLRHEYHVYCTDDSRISIAGITSANVNYVAESIYKVCQ